MFPTDPSENSFLLGETGRKVLQIPDYYEVPTSLDRNELNGYSEREKPQRDLRELRHVSTCKELKQPRARVNPLQTADKSRERSTVWLAAFLTGLLRGLLALLFSRRKDTHTFRDSMGLEAIQYRCA